MKSYSKRIIHFIPNLCVGGAETFLIRLIPFLPSNQIIILFWGTKNMPSSRKDLIPTSCRVICVDPFNTSCDSIFSFFRLLISLSHGDYVFSWLHTSDFLASLIKLLHPRNFKLYWNIRNIAIRHSEYSRLTYVCYIFCLYLLKWVPDKVIFNSYTAQRSFVEKGLPSYKCTVIHNGFNISALPFHSRTVDDPFTIICCARFHPQKNHMLLLQSFAQFKKKCPESLLILVGPGCDVSNQQLMSFLNNLDIVESIVLHSALSYKDTLSVMRTGHVSMLLSSFGESFPNVVAESVICGCYPIATDVGDSSEIIASNGKVFPLNSTPDHICLYLNYLYLRFKSSPMTWNHERLFYAHTLTKKFSLSKSAQHFVQLL